MKNKYRDLMSTLKEEESVAMGTILKFMESPLTIHKNKDEIKRLLCCIDPADDNSQEFLAEINKMME